tara:strand:- start:204 stop:944 length:741 start_codon:yes stop_codon:yes gene_type:complete
MIRNVFAALAVLTLAAASPVSAKNNKTPGGDPCGSGHGRGTGNPCNGNNGNDGANGNSGGHGGTINEIPKPDGFDSGAYIVQIGATNSARIEQSRSTHYARIIQRGEDNKATADQSGSGVQFAELSQKGTENDARIIQRGDGENVLYMSQKGNFNTALVDQNEGGVTYNAAVVSQDGNGNDLVLNQDGSDNQASLTQDGNANAMTAVQLGDANRLSWSQTGHGLSDLAIEQTGGAVVQISQTNGGR